MSYTLDELQKLYQEYLETIYIHPSAHVKKQLEISRYKLADTEIWCFLAWLEEEENEKKQLAASG